jgi:hypothetical protein
VVSVDGPLIDERVATEAQMLIENIREQLEDGANLASIAAVSRNSPRSNQTTADHDRARVIRLFEMIRDEKQLLHEIEKQVGKLADEVDHSQQLMPVALQGSSVNQVAPSLVIKAENGRTVVGTTLYWMPYRLEFSDPDLVDWSERVAADQPMTAVAILRQFQDGFARGLDYEVLLALGYVLGALDRWDLALPYSDLALLQAGLSSPPQPSHEGKFFKALCLRMLSLRPGESTRQLADRYREAVDLLDEAIDSRKRAESRPDARYAIEKATVLLRWSRLEWVADDANALGRAEALERRAVRATQTALSVTRRDEMARAQIYNILCFHYLETDYTRWVPEIRRHLRLLEEMIEQRPPLREWPPNFLDTVLVAHCRLPDQPLDRDYVRELSGALKEALDKPGVSGIRPRDRARAEAHLAEAEMALSAAAAT